MRGCEDPKDTDPAGGRGKGRGGRKTYIDEIISKSEFASQQPNSWKPKSQPSFQANFETGKEVWSLEIVEKLAGNIEERANRGEDKRKHG